MDVVVEFIDYFNKSSHVRDSLYIYIKVSVQLNALYYHVYHTVGLQVWAVSRDITPPPEDTQLLILSLTWLEEVD